MTALRRVAQVLMTMAITLALVALSRVSWEAEPSDDAVLRLAWRYRSSLVDHCRRLTDAELAQRPAHMRRAEECRRLLRPYRLEVLLDGRLVLADSVGARGARGDRPLSVFQELATPPGAHRLALTFQPYPVPSGDPAPSFALDTAITIAPRQVLLLTMDEGASRLEARVGRAP